jgi:hypothetical protein
MDTLIRVGGGAAIFAGVLRAAESIQSQPGERWQRRGVRSTSYLRQRRSREARTQPTRGSVVASSRADDQRVLLRTSQLLHYVLACQRFSH